MFIGHTYVLVHKKLCRLLIELKNNSRLSGLILMSKFVLLKSRGMNKKFLLAAALAIGLGASKCSGEKVKVVYQGTVIEVSEKVADFLINKKGAVLYVEEPPADDPPADDDPYSGGGDSSGGTDDGNNDNTDPYSGGGSSDPSGY
jgi:hypothetical protein